MSDTKEPGDRTGEHSFSRLPLSNFSALFITLGILLIVGLLFYIRGERFGFDSKSISPEQPHVEVGKDCYISISLVEVSEKAEEGSLWDASNGSAPDLYVEIYWRGNRIYQSTTKEDTFLAKWSVAEVRLKDVMMKGAKTSVDDLIHAARLNIRTGESIEVRVYDSDLFRDTLIGQLHFQLTDLKLGEQIFNYDGPGILRLGMRVNDMSQSVDVLQ